MNAKQSQTIAEIRERLEERRGDDFEVILDSCRDLLQIIDSQTAEIDELKNANISFNNQNDSLRKSIKRIEHDPFNVVVGGPGAPGYDYDDET